MSDPYTRKRDRKSKRYLACKAALIAQLEKEKRAAEARPKRKRHDGMWWNTGAFE